MDEDAFWRIIHDARRRAGEDCSPLADLVVEHLATLPPEDVRGFARVMDELMDRAYTWDLWAAAYIINGGCSDDGFEYFRGWLLTQGQKTFEAALRDPEFLATVAKPDVECEDILYAALRALEQFGEELPPRYAPHPPEPAGERWSEDGLDARFPKLTKAFG